MNTNRLLQARLYAQLLAGEHEEIKTPADVVRHMCAMQAQEYAMAKWAVGLRLPKSTETDMEQAFQNGQILRTHLLRPTWHFVHPDDIRWLIKLTAPHVHAKNKTMYKRMELEAEVLNKACSAMETALESEPLTRPELQQIIQAAGIEASGNRLAYTVMYAELEGLIASGPRRGKQFTYALMDAVAPQCSDLSREEMLAELSRRYFASRVPATARDFAYWSGLSLKDAKRGSMMLGTGFCAEKPGDTEFIISEEAASKLESATGGDTSFLMPDYDEYMLSYKNRNELVACSDELAKVSEYSHWLVVKGVIAGTWKQPVNGCEPEVSVFDQMGKVSDQVELAKSRYLHFWRQR